MRELQDHKINDFNTDCLSVACIDAPDDGIGGGVCHAYRISYDPDDNGYRRIHAVDFQRGPVAEVGVNGISQEALLAIVIDRLRHFQKGPFRCRENALALTKFEEGMQWLHARTRSRVAAGVEGTHGVREEEG